ncbi:cytochrome P450 [Mycena albidolilacea]|uniref:Cytochrome P450 n=1 Tax=Mycena albidolilacea TaxID=1033008 RepID=A0AAD6ZRW8_9AGAR|nr:cytochrome P450 [Mycena albidolilacea]
MHLKFMEWSRTYGDIFSIKIGSSTMVVLSSPTAIKEVVDRNSWAANSRPPNYLARLAAGGYHILFAADKHPNSGCLAKSEKDNCAVLLLYKRLAPSASPHSGELYELMTHPENFSDSIRRYTHSIAMIASYGRRVPSFASPKMQGFYQMLHRFLHIPLPGVYPPIDLVPVLKYLPERWAPWLAVCRRSKSEMAAFHLEHCGPAEEPPVNRGEGESFMSSISKMDLSQEEYDAFSYTGFTLVEAGSHPTTAFLLSLILILAVYPERQERARQEIEAVVGTARLPELEDFKHLPFVEALIKEVIRIRPSFPTGVPHFTTEEIRAGLSYKNYVVPKDTTIVLNIYSIFHNPDIYEDPEVFNPERYMQSEHGTRPGMDTDFRDNFLFGAGRRICPGQSVAQATIRLATMRLIWAFSFSSAVDPKTEQPIGRELHFYDQASRCKRRSVTVVRV